ncbi:MAG: hypothetical protein GY906_13025 [bacterium]|nr:hypothetical protein [bacterium]
MTAYLGRLLIDLEDDDLVPAHYISVPSIIRSADAGLFAPATGGPYQTPQVMVPLPLPTVMAELLLHNWIQGCTVESNFNVDITSALTDAEERRLLSDRPTRSVQVRWTGLSRVRANRALMSLMRHGTSRMPVPLYSDYTQVNSLGASLKSVYCDPRYRRFFAGQRVVIFDLVQGEPANVEYAQIDNVQVTHLVLLADLVNTYSKGAYVFPLIDAEVSLQETGSFITDTIGDFIFKALEVPGASSTLPTATGTPTGYQEHNGDPVFAPDPYLPNAGYRMGFARAGKVSKSGRGQISDIYGSRPKFTHQLKYRKFTRAEAWKVIQFFDSRRARFRKFWLVPPENIWELHSIATTYANITATGNFEDIEEFFEYVAVVMKDGSIHIRTIDNVVDNSSTWRIDFDAEIAGLVPADVARFIPAHSVRFSKGFMREKWHTDQTCDIILDFVEVLAEGEVPLICLT